MRYVALGIMRDRALKLTGITRHQFYYKPFKGKKRGVKPSLETIQIKNGEREKCPNGLAPYKSDKINLIINNT